MPRTAALMTVLVLATAPARAELVSPDAFEALAQGRTLHFSLDGMPFGAEQFLPGRRSLWRFVGGACEPGSWRAEGEAICFVYDREPTPMCWHFRREGEGYAAWLVEDGAETGFRLALDAIGPAPLPCPGPDVGS